MVSNVAAEASRGNLETRFGKLISITRIFVDKWNELGKYGAYKYRVRRK